MSIEAIKKALEGVDRTLWDQSFDGVGVIVSINGQVGRDVHALKRNSDYVKAASPAAISELISEIDGLQRENASLLEDRYKLACAITGGEDAPGLLDSTPTSEIVEIAQHAHRMHQDDIDRAEAAEAEVKRLQAELTLSKPLYSRRQIEARVESLEAALKPFADLAPSYDPPEDDDDDKCWHAESTPTLGDLRRARTTLASTGGEHHAE